MVVHYVIPRCGIWYYLYMAVRLGFLGAMPLLAMRLLGRRRDGCNQPETPLEILNRRFARGEITWEEYERMLREQTGELHEA